MENVGLRYEGSNEVPPAKSSCGAIFTEPLIDLFKLDNRVAFVPSHMCSHNAHSFDIPLNQPVLRRLAGENEAFGLFLIARNTVAIMKYVLMTVPARCKKCGGPIFSIALFSESGLCVACVRMEAARKMSLTLD